MAEISYRVCDRCKDKINYHSRLLSRVQLPKVVKIIWIVCGVTMDSQKELCEKCSEELKAFFEVKKESEGK